MKKVRCSFFKTEILCVTREFYIYKFHIDECPDSRRLPVFRTDIWPSYGLNLQPAL